MTEHVPPHPPMSDEEIEAALVGESKRLDGRIDLREYDPAWPEMFRAEESRIRSTLGDRILLLEHAGSTAVPGLPAKPIIDMVMAVADSSDEASYVPDLERAGYALLIREPDWFEHRMLKGPDTDVNLHVFTAGEPEIDRMLAFRDHLREDHRDRRRYAEVKAELAAREWRYVQNYADAKTPIVTEILERALQRRGDTR